MKLFKKFKRKHYNFRYELAKWVEKNIGIEYVNEALEKYDKINSGIPIGNITETMTFIHMVETAKIEMKGQ